MCADEAVGGRAADEERGREQPEVARADAFAERAERDTRRVGAAAGRGLDPLAAEWGNAEVGGTLAQEQGDDGNRDSGTISMLGVARMPAPARSAKKVTARTIQAGCGRWRAMVSMYWGVSRPSAVSGPIVDVLACRGSERPGAPVWCYLSRYSVR
jgi:hypothetical protein